MEATWPESIPLSKLTPTYSRQNSITQTWALRIYIHPAGSYDGAGMLFRKAAAQLYLNKKKQLCAGARQAVTTRPMSHNHGTIVNI